MKSHTIVLLLSGLALLSACGKDNIVYTDTDFDSAEVESVDCSDLNSDIQVLQAIAGEAFTGGSIVSVNGNTIEFDSGTVAEVTVREAYGFECINPVVSISGKYWSINGTAQSSDVQSSLLRLLADDGVWSCSFDGGQTWSYLSDIESGISIPVFSGFEAGQDELKITLGSGVKFSFEYLDEE